MQGIVVGVSTSATGAAALDWALEQAVLGQVPLTAVRAWEIPSYGPYYSVGSALRSTSPDFELTELGIAQDALREAVARVPGAEAVPTTAVATRGRPPEVLVAAAADADLLVVGTRGVGALTRVVHLGSVSSSVLHHATGPVAVVPEEKAESSSHGRPRIVVGVDDSPRSARALEWAVGHARRRDAVLVPVTVRGQERRKAESDLAEQDAEAVAALRAAAVQAGAEQASVAPEIRCGHAAHELVAAAAEADLLVVGTRGRGGFASLLLGSTTHQVAGHADCPVVVVRSD